ncbi:hypothetical protein SAMN05216324_101230 [Chryseobacterium limigenitum]|uniref:Uncharacterized protein n=1 Tax=Chryseobacterium limigenitum TaxID=1612149 RepID=A0A1K2ICZ6_9FLAO|nr:hypothetical protein SAMN05216324_101230 [Chryseobacterium limigenitum]
MADKGTYCLFHNSGIEIYFLKVLIFQTYFINNGELNALFFMNSVNL